MTEHDLKTWPEQFQAVVDGYKPFEWRKDDGRNFEVNDHLRLREYDPASGTYSGRVTVQQVTHIVAGGAFEIPEGFKIMGIRPPGHVGPVSATELDRLANLVYHARRLLKEGDVAGAMSKLAGVDDALHDMARDRPTLPDDGRYRQMTVDEVVAEIERQKSAGLCDHNSLYCTCDLPNGPEEELDAMGWPKVPLPETGGDQQ